MSNKTNEMKQLHREGYAARLHLPLDPLAAQEVEQMAERVHQDLQSLNCIAIDGLEPPVIFHVGGVAKI